uniref:Uncharacterized protein n=1 Tax=Siphoviridae sp. ct6d71 TaxID=2826298 RepID=A0A8S5R2R0_9CAUD|nr:MAG TPA: hypothetical protein [Siphoviridae sp. ct6d71]
MCSYRQIFISLPLSLRWINYNISLKIYQVFFSKKIHCTANNLKEGIAAGLLDFSLSSGTQ